MKTRNLILALALWLPVALAETPAERIYVDVNGMVCDFCARSLEKVFGKQDAVSGIDVDLDNKIITIDLNEGMDLEDELISTLVEDAGYSVVGIRRAEGGASESG